MTAPETLSEIEELQSSFDGSKMQSVAELESTEITAFQN